MVRQIEELRDVVRARAAIDLAGDRNQRKRDTRRLEPLSRRPMILVRGYPAEPMSAKFPHQFLSAADRHDGGIAVDFPMPLA
jgi:hypothetical protein